MSMRWFRVYSEIKDDPKMLCLGDHEFRWSHVDELGLVCFKEYCDCQLGQQQHALYQQEVEAKKRRLQQQRIQEIFGAAMIPERFQAARLEDFDQQSAAILDLKDAWANGQGLLLWGAPGTGKTHLAVALLKEKLEAGIPGIFVEVPDLLARVRAAFDGSGKRVEDIVEAVCVADVVVLDDLGAEKASEWVREQIFRIVNSRYNHCRLTIVTSNLGTKDLAARVGDRTVSRLVGMCRIVRLDGVDRRLANAPTISNARCKNG